MDVILAAVVAKKGIIYYQNELGLLFVLVAKGVVTCNRCVALPSTLQNRGVHQSCRDRGMGVISWDYIPFDLLKYQ